MARQEDGGTNVTTGAVNVSQKVGDDSTGNTQGGKSSIGLVVIAIILTALVAMAAYYYLESGATSTGSTNYSPAPLEKEAQTPTLAKDGKANVHE